MQFDITIPSGYTVKSTVIKKGVITIKITQVVPFVYWPKNFLNLECHMRKEIIV